MGPSYAVHVSGSGNVFMREIAELVVAALADLGRDAELRIDKLPSPTPGQIDLVVAPHEFFPLLDGASPDDRRRAAERVVCIGTEQPGTPWFELSAGFAALGPAVLDISPVAVSELQRWGVHARHLQLGYHESWDRWHGADRERPVDILFLGALTAPRAEFLSAHGRFLSAYECELRLFGFEKPVDETTTDFLVGDAKRERLASAKILLNLHRSAVPYFEWMRGLEAIANGCVLLTEPADGMAPLVPFEHVVAVGRDELIGWAGALLADESLRSEIATTAHDFVRQRLHFSSILERELPVVEDAVRLARTQPGLGLRRLAPLKVRAASIHTRNAVAAARRAVRTRFKDALHRPDVATAHDVHELKTHVKNLMLASRRLQRTVEATLAELHHGEPGHIDTTTSAAWDGCVPEVSVVLPVYDYEHLVSDAIESVVRSGGAAVELIVVDDHSSDRSLAVARQHLVDHDWFPMMVVSKAANEGLSAARNTGFELARAERVFLLDADNVVYPNCLRLLADALDTSDAAFAYGIVEQFGDGNGLVSCLPWDPARLVRGNYIDAMAMIRKDAWRRSGGFDPSVDARFGGWEDFDFWLHLAELGYEGRLEPQVVARYRKHAGSMLSTLNLETQTVFAEFRRRYPSLPWPAA